VPNRQ